MQPCSLVPGRGNSDEGLFPAPCWHEMADCWYCIGGAPVFLFIYFADSVATLRGSYGEGKGLV